MPKAKMNKGGTKRIVSVIFNNKPIRVMVLLTFLFVAINISMFILSVSYKNRASEMQLEIQNIQVELDSLQKTVTEPDEEVDIDDGIRGFAPYEEIVPFISLLEDLFGLIDPEAEITIKNDEAQILANRYADYEIKLNAKSKKTLLFKAMDELYNSKYVTKIISSNMDYRQLADTEKNDLEKVSFVIRLYFE